MDYWKECIAEAFEDAKIEATDEQVGTVASWAKGAHDNYGMAHGHDCIPNPLADKNKDLKNQLRREQEKEICDHCKGKGHITENAAYCNRSSSSSCFKCNGSGFIYGI